MSKRWRVTVLAEDGRWVPVEVDTDSMESAVSAALGLDWVENVVECEPLATLNEEVRVEPEGGDPGTATSFREVGGERRWVLAGEPEEDWWTALSESGARLPGDWEYDRESGTMVCSII